MNKANGLADRIKVGLGLTLLVALTGCVGYVDGGGDGGVVVDTPGVWVGGVWNGGYIGPDRAHAFAHRGAVSRGFAHGGGFHGGGGRR
jgi:hypothetical protein